MPKAINAYQLREMATPSGNAPAGTVLFYAKSDNTLYSKDELGVERNIVGGDGTILRVVAMTQAAYNALGTKDPQTLYVVT